MIYFVFLFDQQGCLICRTTGTRIVRLTAVDVIEFVVDDCNSFWSIG